jgi:outer membrane receptor protein involved in Fe transport
LIKLTKFHNACLVVTAYALFSQSVESSESKIEIIEVTAQKRSQSITEIPMTISAFNSEQLTALGIEDTTDLANIIPGFNYSDTAFGPPVYTLRGVGFNESSAQATSTVGVYVDEVTIPFPIMTKAANLDLERVEVLKGPQGTLFGRNSTAGAVSYIAAKPQSDFESGVIASIGSYQSVSGEAFITGALNDNINARAAFKSVNSNEGWQESVSRNDQLGKKDKQAARVSFDWRMSNTTQALISLSYFSDNSDTLAPQAIEYIPAKAGGAINGSFDVFGPILNFDKNPQFFPGNSTNIRASDWTADREPSLAHELFSISINLSHEYSDSLSLVALSGYHHFKDEGSQYERGGAAGVTAGFIRNLSGGSLDIVFDGAYKNFYEGHLHGSNATVPDEHFITSDYVYQHGEITSFSQELRLSKKFSNANLISGLYFSKSEVDYDITQDWGLATNVNILPTLGFGFNSLKNSIEQETTTIAIFTSLDWQLNDKWTYTVGLRYSDDKAEYDGCTKDIDGSGLALFNQFFFAGEDSGGRVGDCVTVIDFGETNQRVGQIQDTLDEDSLSWRLAANYQWLDNTTLFASYSRGFKAGSYPSLAAIVANQLDPVVQEKLDAYEVGFKANFAEQNAQLNMSAFYYDYKNKQLLTKKIIPVFSTAFTLGNIEKSYVQGLEVAAQWYPSDNLYINAAASYIDTEVKSGEGFNQLGQALDFSGSPLPFSADLQLNFLAKYTWEIHQSLQGFISTDWSYTSAFNADFKASVKQTNQVADFIGSPVEVVIPPQPYEYDERFTQNAYSIINMSAGVENTEGDWKLYFWVRNLADEYHVSSVVKNNEMISAYPGMTRTYGLTFEMRIF